MTIMYSCKNCKVLLHFFILIAITTTYKKSCFIYSNILIKLRKYFLERKKKFLKIKFKICVNILKMSLFIENFNLCYKEMFQVPTFNIL